VIGRKVFDRGADFDPSIDPIVRVEATRLRSKLLQYYRTEGRHDSLVITLPKGGYVPAFRRKRRSSPPAVAPKARAIAVLPFHNLSTDPARDFLCEGIAEELIHVLSRIDGIRVISGNSTRRLKSAVIDLRFAAEQLKAGFVVEGSVRDVGGRVRVSAQLVETEGFCCLASASYDVEEGDVPSLREKLVGDLTLALPSHKDTPQPRRTRASTYESPEHHSLYLKGNYHLNRRSEESLAKSIRCFETLIGSAPAHARGLAGLSRALVLRAWHGYSAPHEVMPRAKAAASQAVKLDPRSAEAHIALGLVRQLYDWDWIRALQDFQLAVDLEPSNATALYEYGFFLSRKGELDGAFPLMRRALELDPLSPAVNTNLGVNYYYQRNFEQALRFCHDALELDPGYQPAHYRIAQTFFCLGRITDARRQVEVALRRADAMPLLLALSGFLAAQDGDKSRARAILNLLVTSSSDRYISPASIAILWLGMNQLRQCLDWLEQARHDRDVLLVDLAVDPLFAPLRSSAGFRELLGRTGLNSLEV